MKIAWISALKIFAFATVFLLTNCAKEKGITPGDCSALGKKALEATDAWSEDLSNKSKCEAYKSAIREIYKNCPDFYNPVQREVLDAVLAEECE